MATDATNNQNQTLFVAELRSPKFFTNKLNHKFGDGLRFLRFGFGSHAVRQEYHEKRLSAGESAQEIFSPNAAQRQSEVDTNFDNIPRISDESESSKKILPELDASPETKSIQGEKLISIELEKNAQIISSTSNAAVIQSVSVKNKNELNSQTDTEKNPLMAAFAEENNFNELQEELNNCYDTNMLALIVAKYYEKFKDNKDNLSKFNLKPIFFQQMENWIQKSQSVEYYFLELLSSEFTIEDKNKAQAIQDKINEGHNLIKSMINAGENFAYLQTNAPSLFAIKKHADTIVETIANDDNDINNFHESHHTLQQKIKNTSFLSALWAGSKEQAVIRKMIANLEKEPITIDQLIVISSHHKLRDALKSELERKRTTGWFIKKPINNYDELLSSLNPDSNLDSNSIDKSTLQNLLHNNYEKRTDAIKTIKNFQIPSSQKDHNEHNERDSFYSHKELGRVSVYIDDLDKIEEQQHNETEETVTTVSDNIIQAQLAKEQQNEISQLVDSSIVEASNKIESITKSKIIHSIATDVTNQIITTSHNIIQAQLAKKQQEILVRNEVSDSLQSIITNIEHIEQSEQFSKINSPELQTPKTPIKTTSSTPETSPDFSLNKPPLSSSSSTTTSGNLSKEPLEETSPSTSTLSSTSEDDDEENISSNIVASKKHPSQNKSGGLLGLFNSLFSTSRQTKNNSANQEYRELNQANLRENYSVNRNLLEEFQKSNEQIKIT